jgi:hypothetical protein
MCLQTLYQLYVINAGQVFKMLWGTIKSFLDPETASKIHVSIALVYCIFIVSPCAIMSNFWLAYFLSHQSF